jgi:hypothetical protein
VFLSGTTSRAAHWRPDSATRVKAYETLISVPADETRHIRYRQVEKGFRERGEWGRDSGSREGRSPLAECPSETVLQPRRGDAMQGDIQLCYSLTLWRPPSEEGVEGPSVRARVMGAMSSANHSANQDR